MFKSLLAVAGVVAVGAVAYTLLTEEKGGTDHTVVDGETTMPDLGGGESAAPAI